MIFNRPKRNPGKLNTTINKLSRLEMSGDYSLPRKTFQFIQETLRCYPTINMFASKKNRLLKKFASVIPTKDPDNVGNRLEKVHIPCIITSPDTSDSENYTEICQRGLESHLDRPEMEETSMVNPSRGVYNVKDNSGRCRNQGKTWEKEICSYHLGN
jgi:hypothetical protein